MNKLKATFLIICSLVSSICLYAQQRDNEATISGLRAKLATVKTSDDSIKIYYDILDLAPRRQYKPLAAEIWDVAARAGRTDVQLEISRQLTAAVKKDSVYDIIEKAVASLPESDEQKETLLFVRMKRISYKSRYETEEQRQKEISDMIKSYDVTADHDKYDRLLRTFNLVEYLRNNVSGELLQVYISRLLEQGLSEDFSLYAIPNIIFAEAANAYTMAQDYHKALDADRKLLEVIDGLEKKYAAMGRKYRNYDVSRYVFYRRMLQNFEALAPGEAQKLYDKAVQLGANNSDVRDDLANNPTTGAFYNMAIGNFTEAIPLLKKLNDTSTEVTRKRRYLELLIHAATSVGDEATRVEALENYNHILDEYSKLKASERYRELQVKYDIKSLKERNAALELENVSGKLDAQRRIMVFVIFAFVILLITFIITLFNWYRFRKNSIELGTVECRLGHERDMLRHKEFYDVGDHITEVMTVPDFSFKEWCQANKKTLKQHGYAAGRMTQNIMNDLLLIAFLGKKDRMAHISDTSVDGLMRSIVSKATENNASAGNNEDNTGINTTYPDDDYTIETDVECVTHVLCTILAGMVKHNESEENITFETALSDNGYISFIITSPENISIHEDTRAYADFIYTDALASGAVTGSFINRLIALLLDSEVKADVSCKHGSRLIFTTPANLS